MRMNELASKPLVGKPTGRCTQVLNLSVQGNNFVAGLTVTRIIELERGVACRAVETSKTIEVFSRVTISEERMREENRCVTSVGLNDKMCV